MAPAAAAGGGGQARQLSALDARDVLADGIDLVDGGARGQEQAGGGLLFLEGDARGGQGQERRSAARDQADHQVVAAGGGDDLRDRSEERRVGKEGRSRWSP